MKRESFPRVPRENDAYIGSILSSLWRRFIRPAAGIREPDRRRQAALLSAFLLVIICSGILLELITLALIQREDYIGYRSTVAVVIVLSAIYVLSRTTRYQTAAVLTVGVAALGTFAAGWVDPSGVRGGLLDYLIVPIWLGALYLSLRGLAFLICSVLAGLLVFPLLVPEVQFNDILIGPFGFVLSMSILLIVVTRHRNLLEQDRQAELAEKERRSRHEAARAAALLRVAGRLNAELDLDTLLEALGEEVAQALDTPISLVTLFDPAEGALRAAGGHGLPTEILHGMPVLPRSVYDQTLEALGAVFAIPDLQDAVSSDYLKAFQRLQLRSLAFASMSYEGELIGSLVAFTRDERRDFSEDELLLLRGLADQAALAIVNTRLFKDARRRLERLQALRAIDMAITANHDLRRTLEVLLDQITNQLTVDAAVFLLLDESRQQLAYAASRGFQTPTLQHTRLRLGDGIAGRAAQRREVIEIRDLRTDPQTLAYAPSLAQEGFASYFAVPLIAQGEVKGVVEIFHRTVLDPDREWLDFLEALAGQAAIAIESTSLFDDLQHTNAELSRAYDSTIEGWSRALDLRDKETEGHTRRVMEMTIELARLFGFGPAELLQLRRGALLHDIGKMGVPDRILLKPGPLTEAEWEIMRKHPDFAHEMLLPIDYLRGALDIPYCHHEKWDGTGYPRGLQGEQIPLAARIFAVVDVWDALTSHRPYRDGWPPDKAIAHIREQAGVHFDPRVVEKFIELVYRPS